MIFSCHFYQDLSLKNFNPQKFCYNRIGEIRVHKEGLGPACPPLRQISVSQLIPHRGHDDCSGCGSKSSEKSRF